jgi:hypothetical protein
MREDLRQLETRLDAELAALLGDDAPRAAATSLPRVLAAVRDAAGEQRRRRRHRALWRLPGIGAAAAAIVLLLAWPGRPAGGPTLTVAEADLALQAWLAAADDPREHLTALTGEPWRPDVTGLWTDDETQFDDVLGAFDWSLGSGT